MDEVDLTHKSGNVLNDQGDRKVNSEDGLVSNTIPTIQSYVDDKKFEDIDLRNQGAISSCVTSQSNSQPDSLNADEVEQPDVVQDADKDKAKSEKENYLVWKRTPENATRCERLRDWLLAFIDATFLSTPVVVIWLILVVIVGAIFFFLAVGAITIGDEDETKEWSNYSIQALNVLFTYTAIFTVVWRLSNAVHLLTDRRSSERGMDLYGQPTMSIWFHLSHSRRLMITITLLVNCITQYINQIMRIIYFSVEDSSSMPGVLLTNLFFVLSFLAGAIAGIMQLAGESRLRHLHPHLYKWSGMTDPVDKLYNLYSNMVHSEDEGLNLSTTNLGRSRYFFSKPGKGRARRGTTGIIVEEPVNPDTESGQPDKYASPSTVEKPAEVGRSIGDLTGTIVEESVKDD